MSNRITGSTKIGYCVAQYKLCGYRLSVCHISIPKCTDAVRQHKIAVLVESRTAPFATVAVIAMQSYVNDNLYEIVVDELHNIDQQQRKGCWNSLSYTFVQISLFATTLHCSANKYISSSIAKIEITI